MGPFISVSNQVQEGSDLSGIIVHPDQSKKLLHPVAA